jgi:hypothetical protein
MELPPRRRLVHAAGGKFGNELISRFAADLDRGALISLSGQAICIRHLPATYRIVRAG